MISTFFFQIKKKILTCFILLIFCFFISSLYSQTYCSPPSSNCSSYRIDSVSFSNIHNASQCGVNGYTDYSTSVPAAIISAGSYVPMAVKTADGILTKGITIAIDFNQNGIFEDNEITKLGTGKSLISDLVRIPFSAKTGNTKLRIRVGDYLGILSMCSNGAGETEDYLINILPAKSPGPNFTFYVNKSATGANDGSAWGKAFPELSIALNYAQGRDTIKVARGIYIPGALQSNTFNIKDSIIILGGYPDSGNPTDSKRNFAANQTIVSGKYGTGSNKVNYIFSAFQELTYSMSSNNFIIDGFIIEDALVSAFKFNQVPYAVIRNCVFRNNNNISEGTSVICNNSSPLFLNCFFDKNIYSYQSSTISVKKNSAPVFKNCIFSNNVASNSIIHIDESSPQFANCNFVNNTSGSKTIYAENNSAVSISNSIFYNNIIGGSIDSSEINLLSSTINISNTITQAYDYRNKSLLAQNPKFVDVADITGVDNLYFTSDDGLQLLNPCSPAINAGLNSTISEISQDVLGKQRIFGSTVDLGAYEVQSAILPMPRTLYVKKSATGANDGSSWANAFTDLQTAFYYCSDTIRVAAGTYFPSSTDEQASFWLENKRIILGGYPNTGSPSDTQRDPSANPTILSGNFLNSTEKTSVYIVRGRMIDSTTTLDGLVFANANGSNYTSGRSGIYLYQNSSLKINNCKFSNNENGILIGSQSNPIITNSLFENNANIAGIKNSISKFIKCTFQGNSGPLFIRNSNTVVDSCLFKNNGLAVNYTDCQKPLLFNSSFNNGTGTILSVNNSSPEVFNTIFTGANSAGNGGILVNENLSSPLFKKCIFENGYSVSNGGICFNDNSSPEFIGCVFRNSKSQYGKGGGAFYNQNLSNPKIINCIAYGNSAGNQGSFMYSDNSNPVVINSTIVNHALPSIGSNSFTGGIFSNNNSSKLTLYNSIMWGNEVRENAIDYNGEIIGTSVSLTEVKNCITQNFGTNAMNGNIVGINPRLIDITNPAGPDSTFFTSDDGLNICSCSPVINKGANVLINGIASDILMNSRIFNGTIDMGAYEFQSASVTQSKTYFVNSSATGMNDGSSWDNAYKELKTAIENTCSDTIKVAMGTYKPAIKNRDSSFNINRGITILGGYPNTGKPADKLRNTDLYPTILSGDTGIGGDSTDNSYNIMKISCPDTSVHIEGLIFKFGSGGRGAGIAALKNKNVLISKCRFYNNYGSFGSALFVDGNVTTEQSVFGNNNGDRGTFFASGSNIILRNSVFHNNTTNMGGGVYCRTNAVFENTVFYKNTAKDRGAGVYLEENPASKFINCNFIKNNSTGTSTGIGLYNFNSYLQSSSNPLIRNCIFKDNSYHNMLVGNQNTDWAWVSGSYGVSRDPLNVHNSASLTYVPYDNTNISPDGVKFRNIEDAIGPDGLWFTVDDGLVPDACSQTTDKGDNASVSNISKDILQNPRIYNQTVDIGSYEFTGTFNPLLNIVASDSVICSGTHVTFTAKGTNGGSAPSYQWMINDVKTGSDSATFISNTLKQGDKIKCILTSNSDCVTGKLAESNIITMSISGSLSPSVIISSSNSIICKDAAVTFTAIAKNAGPAPVYQWQVNNINAGTDSSVFTKTDLQDKDQVRVLVTSSLSCASPMQMSSNAIVVSVITPPVAIAGKDTSICAGTFAQLHGSGGNYYHWTPTANLSNPDIAAPIVTPQNSTIYHLTVSNDGICFSSDSVSVNVKETVIPIISISAQTNSVCSGENIIFSATAVNGGTVPFYQWQVNGTNAAGNGSDFSSNKLTDNDHVRVILTSNILCAIPAVASNEITVTIAQLETPVIALKNKKFIITNPDAGAAYTLQMLNGTHWADVTLFSNDTSSLIITDGMYRVKATKKECTRFSNELSSTIPLTSQTGIILYPNPTRGNITVDSLSGNWQTIEIFNLQGRRVLPVIDVRNQTFIIIHVENLSSGFYILKIINKDGEKKQLKFIKQ